MAYKLEREPNGKDALVISGWENGTAPDPYSGLGRMYAVDLETPGEVSVGYPITTSTVSGATLGKPVADSTRFFPSYGTSVGIPDGAAQSYAILDADGHVFESTSIAGTWTYLANNANTTGASSKDGIAYWLGRLWKFRNNSIDYWNGTVWVNSWDPSTGAPTATPMDAGAQHFAYVATNNQLYITNGNSLARIFAPDPAAFDPTTPATYSFSADILSLPVTDVALSLCEVGGGGTPQSTLLIGGAQNAIYPWDKLSTSFSLPIYVGESYIRKMVSVNQNAFIFPGNAGGRGRIYITNGSQADLYFKMPDYVFGEQDPYYEWGDAIFHRNNLVFGCFVGKNDGTGVLLVSQVFALNLDTKAFRSISEILSSTAKGNATVLIGANNPNTKGFSYIVGWDDNGSTPGIGYSGTTAGINSTGGSILTDLIPVGSFLQKTTFTQIEYKLRSPLASGESIAIYPIVDGVAGTQLVFNPNPATGVISGYAPVTFEKAQWLQFQILIIGNSATSGVRLAELRLR